MANPDHLEWLKQGTKTWNAWRRKHRGLRPDLSRDPVSDFEHQIGTLVEVVVNEVMPGRAPTDEGGLAGLDLASADLHGCDLHAVNLSRANLMLANLRGADPRDANLAGTILTSANLSKCDLRGATMNGAILRATRILAA
jgi:hypothetical protein